jgi:hypothetical protein
VPAPLPGAPPADAARGFDLGAAAEAARRLVFPESVAAPAELTWSVLLFASLAVGLALELATLALRAVAPPGEEGGDRAEGGAGDGAAPAATPSPADLDAAERARLRDRVIAERYRGLSWLAVATAAALWTAGLLSGPNALAP